MENRRRWQLKLLLAPYPGLTKIHMEKESFPVRGIIYFMADCPYLSIHLSIHLAIYLYYSYIHTCTHMFMTWRAYRHTFLPVSYFITGDYHVFLNLELGRQIMPDPYPPLHN